MKKLKKGQLYSMWLSGYREYFTFGDNLEVMANNLLQRYNKYCLENDDKVRSFSDMHKSEYEFQVYIVELNAAYDDEYRCSDDGIYLGDYLECVTSRTEVQMKDVF